MDDPAVLPEEFDLPENLKTGNRRVVDLNQTLAGFYGAIAQYVISIRGRADAAPLANDSVSFDKETADMIANLEAMRHEAKRQRAVITSMGGVAFAMPQVLTDAITDVIP